MRNPEQVLNILAGHSNEPEYKYERLYRILFNEQMFFAAYQRMYAKPGNMTPWKSHATLTLLATQDLPTFGYNMIDPLKSWCWGSILFYPFKISRFS